MGEDGSSFTDLDRMKRLTKAVEDISEEFGFSEDFWSRDGRYKFEYTTVVQGGEFRCSVEWTSANCPEVVIETPYRSAEKKHIDPVKCVKEFRAAAPP